MQTSRFLVNLMLGAMLLVPFTYFFQSTSEAATFPFAYKPQFLLTNEPLVPLFDQIRKLERPVIAVYTVKGRQDLWSICKRFHVDAFTIRSSNDLDVSVFNDGTVLKIPSQKGTLYEVEKPETLRVISQGYARGKSLGNAYEREILEANNFPAPDTKDPARTFAPGTELFLPLAYKPTGLGLPFRDLHYRITSGFGMRHHTVLGINRRHDGFDLAKPYGSPVMTAREGSGTYAGC